MRQVVYALPLVSILLTSCQWFDGAADFQWAEIDESKVRSAVMKMTEDQNLLDDELIIKADHASKNMQQINDQIKKIKQNKRDLCFEKYTHKKSKDDTSSKAVEPLFIREGSSVTIVHDPHEAQPLLDCLYQIDAEEELRKLNDNVEVLGFARINRDRYKEAMSRVADDAARQGIINFSEQSKYDLITSHGNRDIIYNRDHVVVDITGAVIEFIEHSKPDLSVKYFSEN